MKATFLLFFFIVYSFSSQAQDWRSLSDSLIVYYKKKDFEQALPWAEKATVATKEKFGPSSPVYASYLTMLAGLYINTQRLPKAIPVLIESMELYRINVGEEHKDFIQTLNLLAVTYSNIGQNYKAEPLFVQAAAISKKKAGQESADYAASLNKLAKVYEEMGQYGKAEPLFIQALAIRKKIGESDAEYATSLNNLALLYTSMGEYEKAEPLLLNALGIRKDRSGERSLDYANSLNNLAALYETLGQNEKAESYYQKAINIFKEKAVSGDYAISLGNLALVYQNLGDLEKTELLLSEAIAIQKKLLGEEHPAYLLSLKSLASNYLLRKQYNKAEELYSKIADTEKKVLGEKHPDLARTLNDLAYLYRREEKYKKAETLYLQAIAIFKEVLGEQHPEYAATLSNLAALYQGMGNIEKAESLLTQAKKIETKNLLNEFTVLSEKEKADYLVKQSALNHVSNSFLYNYPAASQGFYQENFDLQLLLKGLSLTDTRNVTEAIRTSSDSLTTRLFIAWQQHKIILAKQYSLRAGERRSDLVHLEEQTEQEEKELNRLSVVFRNQQQELAISWKDIQKNLQPDEAAIEFVSFNLYRQQWTDTIMYAAYLVRKNDPAPIFVPLTDENSLQQLIDSAGKTPASMVSSFYRGMEVKGKGSNFFGNSLYKLVWQPLEQYLTGIKKISYSPAGKLYGIAFNALATADSGVLLIDKYMLDQYSSTRQLVVKSKNAEVFPKQIALFGNPVFTLNNLQLAEQKKRTLTDSSVTPGLYSLQKRGTSVGEWSNLSGTAEEVKKINELFRKNKIGTNVFTQTAASEENLKEFNGRAPQILHIATHGFFLPSPGTKLSDEGSESVYKLAEDPLLRSGLVFAGANAAWTGKAINNGVEDGIATAYEISQLNLNNTELVVLSACETALGDIKGSEGVFGLQRAFKMAGVKKMIVSLWQVPDKETVELMTSFYSYWIGGKPIAAAFRQAQAAMRKKYSPFYWAAFVLIE